MSYGFDDNKKLLDTAKERSLPKYMPVYEKVYKNNRNICL